MKNNKKELRTVIIIYAISWIIAIIFMLISFSSCSPYRRIYHKPTHREIKKAMKYSTSDYYNVWPANYYHQISIGQ